MPSVDENLAWWSEYDWPEGGAEWTDGFGGADNLWHWVVYPRIRRFFTGGHVLELAPGFGLWTAYLRPLCERMTLVDLTPKCIEACRERYGKKRMAYHVNDGYSLEMIADDSIDFVFSLHSLVHASHDVMDAYVTQLGRKLKPGGYGFIHHSNLGQFAGELTDEVQDWEAWRGRDMTAEKFAESCERAGLACLVQEKIWWVSDRMIDCYSLFRRPLPGEQHENHCWENEGFWPAVWSMLAADQKYKGAAPEEARE